MLYDITGTIAAKHTTDNYRKCIGKVLNDVGCMARM